MNVMRASFHKSFKLTGCVEDYKPARTALRRQRDELYRCRQFSLARFVLLLLLPSLCDVITYSVLFICTCSLGCKRQGLVPVARTYALLPVMKTFLYITLSIYCLTGPVKVQFCIFLQVADLSAFVHVFDFRISDFLSTLFSKTLNLCSSHNLRDQFSHPCKTTVKIISSVYLTLYIFARIPLLGDEFGGRLLVGKL